MSYVLVEDMAASWERYSPVARSLGSVPNGLVLHVAGPTDEGFRIVQVWETEADWLAFSDALDGALAEVDPAVRTRPVVRAFATSHVVIGRAGPTPAPGPTNADAGSTGEGKGSR